MPYRDGLRACTICDGELVPTRSPDGDHEFARCSRCDGVWIHEQALGQMATAIAADTRFGLLSTASSPGERRCPDCGVALFPADAAGVAVERCGVDGGVWLDRGELEAALVRAAEVRAPDPQRATIGDVLRFFAGVFRSPSCCRLGTCGHRR